MPVAGLERRERPGAIGEAQAAQDVRIGGDLFGVIHVDEPVYAGTAEYSQAHGK